MKIISIFAPYKLSVVMEKGIELQIDANHLDTISPEGIEYSFENAFFAQFEDSDIHGGSFKVVLHSETLPNGYDITLKVTGTVQVCCTRCNEIMDFSICTEDRCKAVDGDGDFDEECETILIHPKYKTIDLTLFLYDTIVLSLPIQIYHQNRDCSI